MRKLYVVGAAAVAAAGILYAAGTHHILTGSMIEGMRPIGKISFSLSEFVINIDALEAMPPGAARAQYPLYMAEMDRRGVNPWAERDFAAKAAEVWVGMRGSALHVKMGEPYDQDYYTGLVTWRSSNGLGTLRATIRDGTVIDVTRSNR